MVWLLPNSPSELGRRDHHQDEFCQLAAVPGSNNPRESMIDNDND
jgi:hypothetical protein